MRFSASLRSIAVGISIRQCLQILKTSKISNSHGRVRFKILWDVELFPDFVGVNTNHLVDVEAPLGRLHSEKS